jgi:hypothetical protein
MPFWFQALHLPCAHVDLVVHKSIPIVIDILVSPGNHCRGLEAVENLSDPFQTYFRCNGCHVDSDVPAPLSTKESRC